MSLRVFAHGGGVQSTAALVLSAQGRIDFPVHLFSNVGDDSENPETLDYFRWVSAPYALEHGVELVELRREWRDGRRHTLLEHMTKPGMKGTTIPVRGTNGSPMPRDCTSDFKVGPILKWLKAHGASATEPAVTGLGITVDEIHRANMKPRPLQTMAYPLLDLGLRRQDCFNIIERAGLPEPPKSACYFCPYHRIQTWAELRRDHPDRFEAAARLEDTLRERGEYWLTDTLRPIRESIGPAGATLFDQSPAIGECDEGVCFV